MFLALRHPYKSQNSFGTWRRRVINCLTVLIASTSLGCVDDDTTGSSAGRLAKQCEIENNRRANEFYKKAAGNYAATMKAGAALNIHTGCSIDPAYSWDSPY